MSSPRAFCHLILNLELLAGEVLAMLKDVDSVVLLTVMKLAPLGIRELTLAVVVVASISTLLVTFMVLSAALVRDIIQSLKPRVEEVELVTIARVVLVIFALIAPALAINPSVYRS